MSREAGWEAASAGGEGRQGTRSGEVKGSREVTWGRKSWMNYFYGFGWRWSWD